MEEEPEVIANSEMKVKVNKKAKQVKVNKKHSSHFQNYCM